MKLAFHVCCAPCMILPSQDLLKRFPDMTLVYYNPNIAPQAEYELRRSFVFREAERFGIEAVELDYDTELWYCEVDVSEKHPERCLKCYEMRLRGVAKWASTRGYTHLSTSLSISPYQDEEAILEIGKIVARGFGLTFLEESFLALYPESRTTAQELDIYRQNYCGCLPSKAEAEAERAARKAERAAKKAAKQAQNIFALDPRAHDENLSTDDFDYELSESFIAQEPLQARESCRLLVMNKEDGAVAHKIFSDIIDLLDQGDLLVLNETKVLPARIQGIRAHTGAHIELLLLKERSDKSWECLVKPGRKARLGDTILFINEEGERVLSAQIIDEFAEGIRLVRFDVEGERTLHEVLHEIGEMPLPPYISKRLDDPSMYQTVFASDEHSAAAPTAGLHFTDELLKRIQAKGVRIAKVRLDVGLDTFRPVKVDRPYEHVMHSEYFQVSEECAEAIKSTKAAGKRVIAVGTTATRALESACKLNGGEIAPASGPTRLFILPGYKFCVVDALITNFHVPRSTLMMMVSAFSSREHILAAYEEAKVKGYRFLSFGDAMFLQ